MLLLLVLVDTEKGSGQVTDAEREKGSGQVTGIERKVVAK